MGWFRTKWGFFIGCFCFITSACNRCEVDEYYCDGTVIRVCGFSQVGGTYWEDVDNCAKYNASCVVGGFRNEVHTYSEGNVGGIVCAYPDIACEDESEETCSDDGSSIYACTRDWNTGESTAVIVELPTEKNMYCVVSEVDSEATFAYFPEFCEESEAFCEENLLYKCQGDLWTYKYNCDVWGTGGVCTEESDAGAECE